MKTSSLAKNQPLKTKQALCDFIRKKIAPDIDYPEWLEIEKDITETRKNITRYMMEGLMTSLGHSDLPQEAQEIFKTDIAKLDDQVREEMRDINLDELKKKVPEKTLKKLSNLFDLITKTKGEK